MLPSDVVGGFLAPDGPLGSLLKSGDTVIDGGNTFYKDSVARGQELGARGIHFFDSGTSGGVWGEANGFALMVGGPKDQWQTVEPIFKALSSGSNYGLVGTSGAGHFVKMVHNGIEYGMMEAIGEGYAVMEAAPFGVDLLQVTKIYQEGSVVRSWLIDLVRDIFEKEDLAATKGIIGAKGEGEWTVNAGKEFGVDVRVIEASLDVRRESQQPENQNKFSNKIVALLRKQFGGHAVVK
jgi:6-phosphogluconate dehydrogenase